LPAHVRAASAIRRQGSRLVVVQDDVNAFAALDVRTGIVQPILLPAGLDGSRVYDDRRGNKAAKLDLEASVVVPHHSLRGFQRITLAPDESRRVVFELGLRELSLIDEAGRRVLEPGRFRATVGGSQPDPRSVSLMGQAPLAVEFDIEGDALILPY
jgi:hypothetical protein